MDERQLIQAGFRYALSLCHDRAQAKDLVQEAWVRLRRYPKRSVPLLLRTIRNQWIDLGRRKKLLTLAPGRDADAVGAAPPAPGLRPDLEKALGRLRPEEREVIYLSVVEGYTADEIADLNDQSRNTVLSLLRRGKAKLRESLGEAVGDEPLEDVVS